MPNNKSGYDPLDPFAEKEELFESKDIKKSKAREAKRRADYLKKKEKTENKAKKPSLFSRIKTFFKELPEREDKKKIYTELIISSIVVIGLIVGIIFVITNIVIPKIEEETEKIETETRQEEYSKKIEEAAAFNDDLAYINANEEALENETDYERKIILLLNLKNGYARIEKDDKVKEITETILALPDSDDPTIDGNTFTEIKNRLREEYEKE